MQGITLAWSTEDDLFRPCSVYLWCLWGLESSVFL